MDNRGQHLTELSDAIKVLSSRGLNVSAKWIAELLCGAATDASVGLDCEYEFDTANEIKTPEHAQFLFAKTLFDCKEFRRAAHILDVAHPDTSSYPHRDFFLRCYALYLDGERYKESKRSEGASAATTVNPQLDKLNLALSSREHLDAFGFYIHGVVLKELGLRQQAVNALVTCVRKYPMLWSAWLDLATLMEEEGQVLSLELPAHWMTEMFKAHAFTELQANNAALEIYVRVSAIFPNAAYVQGQVARCFYNLRQFRDAADLLTPLASSDPYRIDDVDILSNIYYVSDDRASLAALAHRVFYLDKYRPEVCCVIGNYYSLRHEHEKAVCYFRRALRVNKNYLSAWTLMGHEYVELKNTAAAIECYRRAVDINGKDYRAWYGLGQTYELLQLHAFAVYYYKRAVALRPYDPRMWCALGVVCEQSRKKEEAIACYLRAAEYHDVEGLAFLKLAKLYRNDRNNEAAAEYYRAYVGQEGSSNKSEAAQACIFLARQACLKSDWDTADDYVARVLQMPLQNEVMEAKQIIADIRRGRELAGGSVPSGPLAYAFMSDTPSVSGSFSQSKDAFSAFGSPASRILDVASATGMSRWPGRADRTIGSAVSSIDATPAARRIEGVLRFSASSRRVSDVSQPAVGLTPSGFTPQSGAMEFTDDDIEPDT